MQDVVFEWTYTTKENVGPGHEMQSIWDDRREEHVGPNTEKKILWVYIKRYRIK